MLSLSLIISMSRLQNDSLDTPRSSAYTNLSLTYRSFRIDAHSATSWIKAVIEALTTFSYIITISSQEFAYK